MAEKAEPKRRLSRLLNKSVRNINSALKNFRRNFFCGGYKAGKWTYKITNQWIAINYWFSAFSNRKEEVKITYLADDDRTKLYADLKECVGKVREFVKKKTSTF
jgi:hypothetical protein